MFPWEMQDQSKWWNFRDMDPRKPAPTLAPAPSSGIAYNPRQPTEQDRMREALRKARMQGSNPALAGDQPIIDPRAYGIGPQASSAAEGQGKNIFLPGEEDQILDSGFNEGEKERLDRQQAQADALRQSQLPAMDPIRMSSGTTYTPAHSKEAVIANLLAQAAGVYGQRRTEKKRKELDEKEKRAAKLWTKRVNDGVMSPTEEIVRTQNAQDLGGLQAPKFDLGEPTVWEKLRKMF